MSIRTAAQRGVSAVKGLVSNDQAKRSELLAELAAVRQAGGAELQRLRDERDEAYETWKSPERRYRLAVVAHMNAVQRQQRREAKLEAAIRAIPVARSIATLLDELRLQRREAVATHEALAYAGGAKSSDFHPVRARVKAIDSALRQATALADEILDSDELETRIAAIRGQLELAAEQAANEAAEMATAERKETAIRRGLGWEV
jgi:hypothetical protein